MSKAPLNALESYDGDARLVPRREIPSLVSRLASNRPGWQLSGHCDGGENRSQWQVKAGTACFGVCVTTTFRLIVVRTKWPKTPSGSEAIRDNGFDANAFLLRREGCPRISRIGTNEDEGDSRRFDEFVGTYSLSHFNKDAVLPNACDTKLSCYRART